MEVGSIINGGITVLASAIIYLVIKSQIKTAKDDISREGAIRQDSISTSFSTFRQDSKAQIDKLITGQDNLTACLNNLKVNISETYLPRNEFQHFRDEYRQAISRVHCRLDGTGEGR